VSTPREEGRRPREHPLRLWLGLTAAILLVGVLAGVLGVPAGWLLAGLLVGLAVALARWPTPELPRLAFLAAEAVTGAALGTLVEPGVLAEVGRALPAVLGIALGTLGLSVLAGVVLARVSSLDRPTGVFGMLAGAATGVIAASEEARADARLVAVMQFSRVIVVVGTLPVVVGLGFPHGAVSAAPPGAAPSLTGVLLFAAVTLVGAAGANALRIPLGVLIGPLAAAALLAALGAPLSAPDAVRAGAFAVVGLAVGLTFDRDALRDAGRPLPVMLAGTLFLILGSGVLGLALAVTSGVDGRTAYLATSPGGLTAVLVTAYDTGADATFVAAVQVLRFLVVLLALPVVARLLPRRI